jgi:hypothetical protein
MKFGCQSKYRTFARVSLKSAVSGIGIWDDIYAAQSKKWRGVEKVAVIGVGLRETVNSRAGKVKGVCGAEKSGRGPRLTAGGTRDRTSIL